MKPVIRLRRRFAIGVGVLALTVAFAGAAQSPAEAQMLGLASQQTITLSAAAKKKPVKRHRARRATGGRQIACTALGCRPIPRNCRPVTGYDWWGNPTGYDDIVCR